MSPITRETLAARIAALEAEKDISIKEAFYLKTMRLLLAEIDKPQPHHNGMMQLSNELADAKAALRRLSAFARSLAGDIQYTGDHPIAVAEKIAGRDDFFAFGNRIDNKAECGTPVSLVDTATEQFESLAGEPVSERYKLRDAVETIRKSGIDIDAEKIQAERDSLNYPEIPEGSVIVPLSTLTFWRELVDLNPADLVPRIDAYITASSMEVKS